MEGYVINVKIYVKPADWFAYVTAVDEYGDKITCTVSQKTMGEHDISWEDYRDECIRDGDKVEVVKLDK